jgi:hypothetical protein
VKVIVTLTIDGIRETVLEGEASVFDADFSPGDSSSSIGFWLSNWRHCQPNARPHKKSCVFVPWTSCLYVVTKEEK